MKTSSRRLGMIAATSLPFTSRAGLFPATASPYHFQRRHNFIRGSLADASDPFLSLVVEQKLQDIASIMIAQSSPRQGEEDGAPSGPGEGIPMEDSPLRRETLCFDGLIAINSVLLFLNRPLSEEESNCILQAVTVAAKHFPAVPNGKDEEQVKRYRTDDEWRQAFRDFGDLITRKKSGGG